MRLAAVVRAAIAAVVPLAERGLTLPDRRRALAALSCLLLVRRLSDTLGDTTPDADPVEPILRAGPAPQLTAFIAGWLLVAATSALGTFVHHRLGMGLERSVLVGLLLAGGHLSYVAWQLGRLDVDLYRERAVQGGLAVLGSLVMVAGAQLLERACKVPDDPEGDADQA